MRRATLVPLIAILLGATLAGCSSIERLSSPEPSATPASFPGITRVLGPKGIFIDTIVSGDAVPEPRPAEAEAVGFAQVVGQPDERHLEAELLRRRRILVVLDRRHHQRGGGQRGARRIRGGDQGVDQILPHGDRKSVV